MEDRTGKEGMEMATYMEDLSKMLRAVRLACGFSQHNVAMALEVNRSTYTYYEVGRTMPDVPTLKKLADIFSIPAEAFLYPEDFSSLGATGRRRPRKPCLNPTCLGQLSPAEKSLIACYRAGGKPG